MTESNLVEKGFILAHDSVLQFIISGKPQRREFETAGHITVIVHSRGRRTRACLLPCAQFHSSTHTVQGLPSLGNGSRHNGLDLPTSVNLRQSYRDVSMCQANVDNPPLRCTLQVIPACAKLTIKAISPRD